MKELGRMAFFAALNTTKGFMSYFDEIFSPDLMEKIVIVKGGPGTGKSHFLNEIGAFYENHGHEVTYFLCASDPKSLDGVLINDLKYAFMDGTAPHTVDPKYPIAVEKIVDLAVFCNEKELENRRDEIRNLVKAKSTAFKGGYRFLAAAGAVEQGVYLSLEEQVLKDKMKAVAVRFCRKYLEEEKRFFKTVRLISAVNYSGLYSLHSLDEKSNFVCGVDNNHGLGWLYLNEIYAQAERMQKEVIVSYDAIHTNRLNAIYFVKEKLCVRTAEKREEKNFDHYINMDRFIRKSGRSCGKNKVRFSEKCYAALLAGAVEQFALAKEIHGKLEAIYTPSVDIVAKEKFTKEFISSLSEEG